MSTATLKPIPPKPDRDPRDSWLSVTQIIKIAGLTPWPVVSLDMVRRGVESGLDERQLRYVLQGVYPEVLQAKAELGSTVHQAVQDIEERSSIEPWWEGLDIEPYVKAYLKFREDTQYRATSVEKKVYNESYQYHGTYDSEGLLGGKFEAILDVKTTVKMGPEVAYQLAGYEGCLPTNPKRLRIGVQLKKDATYSLHEYKDRNDSKVFLAALTVAQAKGKS